MVQLLAVETSTGGRKLEGPQEVVRLLEVRAACEDFMDKILHRSNSEFSELNIDDGVGTDGDTLTTQFGKATLVNKILDTLQVGVTICDEGFYKSKHFNGGGVDLDEHTVVDLAKAKKLKNLLHFR